MTKQVERTKRGVGAARFGVGGVQVAMGGGGPRKHGVMECKQELPDNMQGGLGKTLRLLPAKKDTTPPLTI